jgi:preprotein translocase subunit YajC
MSGRTIGNLILMTLICVVVFIVFMAVRPTKASAQNLQREAELSDLARPHHLATVLDLISPEAVTCS